MLQDSFGEMQMKRTLRNSIVRNEVRRRHEADAVSPRPSYACERDYALSQYMQDNLILAASALSNCIIMTHNVLADTDQLRYALALYNVRTF